MKAVSRREQNSGSTARSCGTWPDRRQATSDGPSMPHASGRRVRDATTIKAPFGSRPRGPSPNGGTPIAGTSSCGNGCPARGSAGRRARSSAPRCSARRTYRPITVGRPSRRAPAHRFAAEGAYRSPPARTPRSHGPGGDVGVGGTEVGPSPARAGAAAMANATHPSEMQPQAAIRMPAHSTFIAVAMVLRVRCDSHQGGPSPPTVHATGDPREGLWVQAPGSTRCPRVVMPLAEHLVQVVLDGGGADEQTRADLRIGEAAASEPRDLHLLGSEPVPGFSRALSDGFAGREQLAVRALRTPLRPSPPPLSPEPLGTSSHRFTTSRDLTAGPARTANMDTNARALPVRCRLALSAHGCLARSHVDPGSGSCTPEVTHDRSTHTHP